MELAELDARTQVARIEWAVSGLTSNTLRNAFLEGTRPVWGITGRRKSRDTD